MREKDRYDYQAERLVGLVIELEQRDPQLAHDTTAAALRNTANDHLEAAVAKAKRELLDELQNIAEGLSHDEVVPDLADAYDEAATRLRRKYSDPTAVAATEKEG